MSKTVRINLLVSPEEKAVIDARARRASLTTSELLRRAVVAYDPDHDMDELRVLADELAAAVRRMDNRLDATLARVAEHEKALADRRGLKTAARAELEASGVVWPFAVPPSDVSGRAPA